MGRLRAASGLGRAHGGSLDSQLSYARSPWVDKLRAKAVRTKAVRCQGDTGVEATQGYPRRGVGDAVRGTRGRTVSLENSSSLLRGRVPRIPWDKFRGVERRKSSIVWVTCTNSAESHNLFE